MKKTLLFFTGLTLALFLVIFTTGLGEYPSLDSCFKTSVSKKLLCSQNPNYVKLSGVSEYFLKAVVMSEDDSFYHHEGLDWTEFRKSMAVNLRQFAFVRGGSTITQQLVKNVYLTQKKTISRKIVEARLAKKIEKEHSKKRILEKYINAIEFGKNIWGVKQAAEFYFKKSPASLNPLESLYLVVLLPSPVKYSQSFFKKELTSYQKKRMKTLLGRMNRRKIINEKEYGFYKEELEYFFRGRSLQISEDQDEWSTGEDEVEMVEPEEGELRDTEQQTDSFLEPDESEVDELEIKDASPVEMHDNEKLEEIQIDDPYTEDADQP